MVGEKIFREVEAEDYVDDYGNVLKNLSFSCLEDFDPSFGDIAR